MANINNLRTPSVPKLERRVAAVESGAPMNNAGVGRSGFEVYDGGTINVSSGNIIGAGVFSWQGSFDQSGTTTISGALTIAGPTGITGSLTIQGTTSVTGDFTVTGPTHLNGVTDIGGNTTVTGTLDVTGVTTLDGDTTVNGKFDVTGDSTISGTLDVTGAMASKGTLSIEGVTTLKNDLNVTTGGKIKVGVMTLSPIASGGRIEFDNAARLESTSNGMIMDNGDGSSSLTLTDGARLAGGGALVSASPAGVSLTGTRVTLNGKVIPAGIDTTTGKTPNVYIDPATREMFLVL